MTVRTFVIGSIIAAISSWAIWFLIITYLDPLKAGWTGFTLFFLTLFLAVASTSGLLGYITRRIIAPELLSAYAVRSSLRQGVILGLFLSLLLLLQLIRLYQWWLAVIAIILFLSTEFIFLSYDRSTRRSTRRPKE